MSRGRGARKTSEQTMENDTMERMKLPWSKKDV